MPGPAKTARPARPSPAPSPWRRRAVRCRSSRPGRPRGPHIRPAPFRTRIGWRPCRPSVRVIRPAPRPQRSEIQKTLLTGSPAGGAPSAGLERSFMTRIFLARTSCAVFALPAGMALALSPAQAREPAPTPALAPALTDVITVTGQRPDTTGTERIDPDTLPPASGPDATRLVARLPGAAGLSNGALSGQVQYRGLAGARINIRIDGQNFASGGPNLMDPPLHYAPVPLIERIEVDRGVSPVSAGPGLAGGLDAVLKSSRFGEGDDFTLGYDLTLAGHTADESYAAGGLVSLANESWRFHVLGSQEAGGDRETPYGTIGGSEHERRVVGLGGGWQSGGHELGLDLRRSETGPTGNPPFPMDIRYFDTDMAQLRYRGEFDTVRLELRAGWSDVDHAMNNYDLRPAPAMMMQWRETYAQAQTRTLSAALATEAMGGELRTGIDRAGSNHDVTITNPSNTGFYLNSLPDIDMDVPGNKRDDIIN